ncbi:hypothetical protein BGZ83_003486 [Gryganskiella cystojenkinii]|nr:hypothetical protein BGZ83_003486 [Gryganskiella cystojenkinii]
MPILLALGSNGNGQLGIGSDVDTARPCPVLTPDNAFDSVSANNKGSNDIFASDSTPLSCPFVPFHEFAAGGNHTALITRDPSRRLFMTGSNKDGESLLQEASFVFRSHEIDPEDQLNQPNQNRQDDDGGIASTSLKRWRSVACGWAFTIAVTEPPLSSDRDQDGATRQWRQPQDLPRVYAWGSGSFGELGLGPGKSKTLRKAIQVSLDTQDTINAEAEAEAAVYQATKVRAGLRHVLLLMTVTANDTDSTRRMTVLFGWGSNRQGQLGILEQKGQAHSQPFTEKELRGKFMEPTRIRLPSEIGSGIDIIDMACGQNHSLILFSDGSVYSSGLNKYRQLGPGPPQGAIKQQQKAQDFRIGFERVYGLPFVDLISCGWNHNGAMNSRDRTRLFLWGRNDHGQLGNGAAVSATETNDAVDIVKVRIPRASSSASSSDSQSQDDDNDLFEEIMSFSCGSEHCLAMTRSGHCYAWGWNEHGNCGTDSEGIDDRLDVLSPRRIHLTSDSKTSLSNSPGWVAGGYGASWICTA